MHQMTPDQIGNYKILRSLGRGGMGEVFLAADPICRREIALKIIRDDLKQYPVIQERFLREAHVAAQLTHPSIIPIFSIGSHGDLSFYTMPFVEGETLKQVLHCSYCQEKEGKVEHPIGRSIPALTRIFLAVCEAVAYTHSKGILHRDLKPANLILGKYGEVLILDWGVADLIGNRETFLEEDFPPMAYQDLTRPGKVPGTLNFIAPERVRGDSSQVTVDIYSLGIILYQILTLRLPFRRATIQSFRKTMDLEKLREPLEMAPYRDIPHHLSDIATRCLRFAPEERFQSVDEMIVEIKHFLEGKPEWIPSAILKIDKREDWEFQENILLTKHLAITRSPELMEWVCLMISKSTFTGNTKAEFDFKLGSESQGIGFLFAAEESLPNQGLTKGYCLLLGQEATLYHHNIQVMRSQGSPITPNTWNRIAVEKVDGHLFVFFNGESCFHYISHVPIGGSQIGILSRDTDFELGPITVSTGSQNAMVNCLAIPDAFLLNKNYSKALFEYRKIASSFAGRTEGREAQFRAGITILEEATSQRKKRLKEPGFLLALQEFGGLRFTPGAPLEYLGKSLVYKATQEIEEEVKCLELCLRKYPKHPLLSLVKEQVAFRLHESASKDRVAAYHFALLALRHLPTIFSNQDHKQLLHSLQSHLEKIPFLSENPTDLSILACHLSFWLAKPIPLLEMIENASCEDLITSASYALFALGLPEWVQENLHLIGNKKEILIPLKLFQIGPKKALDDFFQQYSPPFSDEQLHTLYFLLDQTLLLNQAKVVLSFLPQLPSTLDLDALSIFAALSEKKWETAESIFQRYPAETLANEYSPLYPLMGCFLRHAQGKEAAFHHFSGSIDLPYPPTSVLLKDFLQKKISEKHRWIRQAFFWEKIQLYRQLHLYYECAGKMDRAAYFVKRLKKELSDLKKFHSH